MPRQHPRPGGVGDDSRFPLRSGLGRHLVVHDRRRRRIVHGQQVGLDQVHGQGDRQRPVGGQLFGVGDLGQPTAQVTAEVRLIGHDREQRDGDRQPARPGRFAHRLRPRHRLEVERVFAELPARFGDPAGELDLVGGQTPLEGGAHVGDLELVLLQGDALLGAPASAPRATAKSA